MTAESTSVSIVGDLYYGFATTIRSTLHDAPP